MQLSARSGPSAAPVRSAPSLYCGRPLVAQRFAGRLPCRCQAAAACDAQVSVHAQPFVRRVAAGEVSIAPLSSEDVSAAAVVLTRAFAEGPDALSYSDVSKFLTALLTVPPQKAQVLVARLAPTDDALLPAGRQTRLVGTAGISIDPAEREFFGPFRVRPKDTSIYLSNMAVDAKFRRQGIAQLLLGACEHAAQDAGRSDEICLIVNQANAAARALYEQAGYAVTDSDSDRGFNLTRLLSRQTPQLLMSKELRAGGRDRS